MFSFIKNLFRKPNLSTKQLAAIEAAARIAVLAVEKPGRSGPAKKAEAVKIAGDLVRQMGLPVPGFLLDIAIEAAVTAMQRGLR